jgi:hypothetical protein
MKKRVRRPSPSILIACLALFLALGGGVYAAAKSSKISGSKIKKSSIAGNRLKKDTLTGKQIKESTLVTVPSASVAADVAGQTRFNFKLGFGQTQTILTAGPFTFTATCLQNTSNFEEPPEPNLDIARILISSSAGGTVFDADSARRGDEGKFLEPTTPESERVISELAIATGKAEYDAAANEDGAAYDPASGTAVSFNQAGLGMGVNVFGPGCLYHGFITVEG